MPLGWVDVPPVPLRWAVLTDIQVRQRSSLAIGIHHYLDITFNEGGSVFSAVNRRMCQATENGQRRCKDKRGGGKITQSSLHTTDIKQIFSNRQLSLWIPDVHVPTSFLVHPFWGWGGLHATPSDPFALCDQAYNLLCAWSIRMVFRIKLLHPEGGDISD